MAFSEFTLESATRSLGVSVREADLFPALAPAAVPGWLPGLLARGTRLALISEKARSEFIVVPILLAARELPGDRVATFSGQRLDVDAARGLSGECDFLLALGPPVPPLRSPIAAVVEAKKNDVEAGLGQCIAQMVAARAFNDAAGRAGAPPYGCVTTGESWQFLLLAGDAAELDACRFYLDNVAGILGAIAVVIADAVRHFYVQSGVVDGGEHTGTANLTVYRCAHPDTIANTVAVWGENDYPVREAWHRAIRMTFPDDWPQSCPPIDTPPATGDVFRIVKGNPVTAADVQSHHQTGKLPKADPCLRCGLSVFREPLDALNLQKLLPKLGDKIANARLMAVHGKACLTRGQQPTHTTWWPYEGVDRAALFVVVQVVS